METQGQNTKYLKVWSSKSEPQDDTSINDLILASISNDRLSRWGKGLAGWVDPVYVKNLADLRTELKRIKPDVLLLDYDLPGLDGAQSVAALKNLSRDTKIVMLSGPTTDDEEWNFFRAGVKGCCRNDIEPDSLKTLVEAIKRGELWIRRTLTHRLLDQLGSSSDTNNNDRACLGLLSRLTRREYEISMQVRKGGSNKQIAQSLEITERTVKAHLTGVYRKLGIVDRLKLAIVLSGDKRQTRRDSPGRKVVSV